MTRTGEGDDQLARWMVAYDAASQELAAHRLSSEAAARAFALSRARAPDSGMAWYLDRLGDA